MGGGGGGGGGDGGSGGGGGVHRWNKAGLRRQLLGDGGQGLKKNDGVRRQERLLHRPLY